MLSFDVGDLQHRRPYGWAAYFNPAGHIADPDAGSYVAIYVRFAPESAEGDAAIEVRELHVAAEGGAVFASPLLRTIPINRMVAAVNRPSTIGRIRPLLALSSAIETETLGSGVNRWMFPPREAAPVEEPTLRITDPGGRRKPDEFYATVADRYLALATLSNRPAQELAKANQLPVTTVHRWLKEARTRGLLRLPDTTRSAELKITGLKAGDQS